MLTLLLAMVGCAEPEPGLRIADGERTIVVRDGVIAAILGPGEADVTGDLVTAGFVDAHAHPAGLGRMRALLDLTGATTYREVLDRVSSASGSGWVEGRGWDQNDWTDHADWPTAADLDTIVPDRPVALRRVDGHALWVNSAALAAAGIGKDTPDPEGGRILRHPDGTPRGVLVDTAMDLVRSPDPGEAEKERRLREALVEISLTGLTGVHDMGVDDATLAIYERLDADGKLPVRIWAYLDRDAKAAEKLLAQGPWRGDRLAVVGIKAYADGALGSRGAHLSEPYADEAGHRGAAITGEAELAQLATDLLAVKAQLAVHAIGDAAVTDVLDAFATARAARPEAAAVRLRVEHAQVVNPADLPRFAALNVVASMQPTHATSDMPWAEARLGPERVRWAYAWRSVLDAGVPLAFGSDFPVEGVAPSLGLWSATRRAGLDGEPENGWYPDQGLTEGEAIAAFTSGSAFAAHEEARLGTIEVGRTADLTVWRVDAGATPPWRPVATVVGGELVWRLP
jgi:predicted amidohydrolase YtcJ